MTLTKMIRGCLYLPVSRSSLNHRLGKLDDPVRAATRIGPWVISWHRNPASNLSRPIRLRNARH